MPPPDNHHNYHPQRHPTGGAPPKQKPKILSLLLQAIIMTLITSLFFLFLGVAALLLLHLCLAGGFIHRRRNHGHPSTPQPNSSTGFSRQDLKRLSQFRYKKSLIQSEIENECVICLERFWEGQWCRKLFGCGHVLHRSCVDSWLVKVSACPTCRTRVQMDSGTTSSVVGREEGNRSFSFGWNSEFRVW